MTGYFGGGDERKGKAFICTKFSAVPVIVPIPACLSSLNKINFCSFPPVISSIHSAPTTTFVSQTRLWLHPFPIHVYNLIILHLDNWKWKRWDWFGQLGAGRICNCHWKRETFYVYNNSHQRTRFYDYGDGLFLVDRLEFECWRDWQAWEGNCPRDL